MYKRLFFFFFQAEDGIRDFCLSRGLGDVYKRQPGRGSNSSSNMERVVYSLTEADTVIPHSMK